MLRKLHWKSLLTIIFIVTVSFTVLYFDEFEIPVLGQKGSDDILGLTLGLDLAGGTQLIYQAGDESLRPTESEMEGLIGTISRRIDRLGVTEPSLQRLGDDRLLIQLPGVEDVQQAKDLIGQTAQLEIIERICADQQCTVFNDQETGLTGDDMSRAFASQDQVTQEPILSFELKRGAAQQFATVTQRIYDSNTSENPNQLAFVLDDKVLVSATVQSPILSGSGIISGSFTPEEARQLAIQVESGRLQIDITELSSSVIAASLGSKSLEEALVAGLVGLALVLLFMTGYYRASGLIAGITLIFYTAIVLAIFKLIPVTLTLAGLAGFILSLGMAVDANILIFERVKEELRVGRTLSFAIQIGFNRAWTSIRDGNVSTILIALVLFFFGSGSANSAITGFSISLLIGVLTSMFTAIFISRKLLGIAGNSFLNRFPQLFTPEFITKNSSGGQN
ncbi:MAG: protein translocase subunit SecD [SAR202 cluster bacterium]|nr:protein translocase subunit SecD [SAR202 cluster bacterium]|tara:strand:+ start:28717 stop:30066 length:1350 start_codon:yes stop_codon:yes gene_type:complete